VPSKWFDYSSYGTIMGVLSVSFLVGDAAARQSMAVLLRHGVGWRGLFFFAAAVAGCILAANLLFLRESRVEAGFPEARVNPLNLFGSSESKPRSVWALLRPLLFNRAFILVCLLSLGTTIVRETFNIWTPTYFRGFFAYSASSAASMSAVFPAVGSVSVIIMGWLSDRLGITGRSKIMFWGLAATALALILITSIPRTVSTYLVPVALVGVVAFCLRAVLLFGGRICIGLYRWRWLSRRRARRRHCGARFCGVRLARCFRHSCRSQCGVGGGCRVPILLSIRTGTKETNRVGGLPRARLNL
jgi:sugar phosphate permease